MERYVVLKLGLMDYRPAWELQQRLMEQRIAEDVPDILILLEHPHTYTLGRRAVADHLLADEVELARLGAQVHWVDRGGDITYHGPGQLVGYPILNLRDWGGALRYLRSLEEVLIQTLADFGIEAGRDLEHTGVWVGEDKIAAIGVKFSRGVTMHGFALNVCPDLAYFDRIVPCGIPDRGITSMERLLGQAPNMEVILDRVIEHFGRELQREIVAAGHHSLLGLTR